MDKLNHLQKTKQELIQEFRQFYYKKAAPLLPDYEENRNKDKLNLYICNMVILGFILVVVGFKELKIAGIVLILSATAILLIKNGGKTVQVEMDYEAKLKNVLMPEFLSLFGNFKWSKSFDIQNQNRIDNHLIATLKLVKENYNTLRSLKILPIFHLTSFDDVIEGKYHDVGIKLLETTLGLKTIEPAAVVILVLSYIFLGCFFVVMLFVTLCIFSPNAACICSMIAIRLLILLPILLTAAYLVITGSMRCLIVEIDMNKNFKGNTCVYEKGLTNIKLKFKKKPELKEVNLEDTKFKSLYNVESTNQIEARYLLTTAFIERFLKIKTAFKAEYIRAEFKNNKLYLVLGVSKDLFAMGNISKKTTCKTFVELFEEIYSVLALVDELKLNQQTGL